MADQASRRESVQPLVLPASRRSFLKTSAVVAGGAFAGTLAIPRNAHAAGDDVLRVGLVGCGGRGTGAAAQALYADKNVKLVAMGDAFSDRLSSSLEILRKQAKIADKIQVTPENCFVGFDAYQKVIDCGVDVVLLCSPPHFRPAQIRAAVAAGKHIFAEKPVAVDAPGVRSVLASCEEAKKKGLSVVSGLCWRYSLPKRDIMQRVLDGGIGDIVAIQATYNTGTLWKHDRKPEWSDMEWQVRNWLYFTWLSGDHNVEQHVHSLDKAAWAMGDEPPVKCWGLGGRQVRTQPEYGNIFDHHAVVYEYKNGVKLFAFTRQMAGCSPEVADFIMGTKGRAEVMANRIIVGEDKYRYNGPDPSMYQQEHDELFAGIRSGQPINNGLYMCRSTMLAIMGRMATYSGQTIEWESAFNSTEDLTPPSYALGPIEVPEVAMPGLMKKARNTPLPSGR
jgi:myo-inositol 2-dehydrogenase/D-chiro-inositol 1-dehydrogenase